MCPIALTPRCGFELCAARPRVAIRHRSTPLLATTARRPVGSATIAASAVRPSSENPSQSRATPRKACSSSTTAASSTSQGGTRPAACRSATAAIIAARPAFVSQAPRP